MTGRDVGKLAFIFPYRYDSESEKKAFKIDIEFASAVVDLCYKYNA